MDSVPDSDLYAKTIAAMAHMLNYFDVSSYDAQMNLQHKESKYIINEVYEQCCNAKKITHADCQRFHANFRALDSVVTTDDDPDYISIHNNLMKCFRMIRRQTETTALALE